MSERRVIRLVCDRPSTANDVSARMLPLRRRVYCFQLFAIGCTLLTAPSRGASDVITVVGQNGQTVTRQGEVQRYNRRLLQLKSSSGVVSRIPADRVIRVSATYLDGYQRAIRLEHKGNFAAALAEYQAAYRAEKRIWVKQQIVARMVACMHADGDVRRAITTYLAMMKHDPETRFRQVIPVPWRPAAQSLDFESEAKRWLLDKKQSRVARLIAASWLLSGANRQLAESALRELSEPRQRSSTAGERGRSDGTRGRDAGNDWVTRLAETQLWRRRVVTVEAGELNQWQESFHLLPDDLKSGPAFVLALGLSRHRQLDEAVVAYLQVVWRDPPQVELAADALWSASKLLQQLGRDGEAKTLLDELIQAYPDSPFAAQAVDAIDRLR